MNTIQAVPLFVFNRLLDNNPDLARTHALISIQEPDVEYCQQYRFQNSGPGVLVSKFHDLAYPVTDLHGVECTPMTLEQAREIVSFVRANQYRHFLIHCTAGVSRSGAVATFNHDYLTEHGKEYATTYEEFKRANPQIVPNVHVLQLLRQASEE